ncbi:small ribosomal subunit Rsm22 family protein [Methanococcoides sp. AM1]|uniref:small ribosomal subunit Rsm22 family protein n=1 Tax=Methanococcoides sp. AM1 TaxID=1201011 RepID=UPI0010825B4B|nr:small ribosomal subunit Rsm22 family protein [Methanococcoides sp. AM1]
MPKNNILSVLKYVSRMKKEFMLSEIKDYIEEEMSTQDIYEAVSPFLFDLKINATPQDEDFRMTRALSKEKLELTVEEQGRTRSFFRTPVVSQQLQKTIEQYIKYKTTKDWDDPLVLEKIRKAIIAQKNSYWKSGKSRNISYEKGYSILAYLAYQFPVYFVQFEHILYSMALDGMLKTRMKILDIGTGPGTVPLSIIDFYKRLDVAEASIHSVELYDENIEAYDFIVPEYAKNKARVSVEKPIKANIVDLKPENIPDKIDLMIFSNVLNEIKELSIEQKAELVKKLSEKLSGDGNIILIEPADRVNSTDFRKLTLALKNLGLGIYSPCSFIWCRGCNPDECWSFEQKEDIKLPLLMSKLAECEEPFRYLNTDIKFSYAIMRKDNLSKVSYKVPLKAKFARLSDMKKYVDKRINVVCSLMSGDLGDDKYSVYKVCDGTSNKQVYAVLPSHNVVYENALLKEESYGNVLELHNVLVKYNKDKGAYNLLLSKQSIVKKAE